MIKNDLDYKSANIEIAPVTVAIPVFNNALYLSKAIESVLNQDLLPSEILIIDDKSSDNSVKVALSYQNKIYQDISYQVIENTYNLNYADNWNKCVFEAQMAKVLILHADDELRPFAIKRLYAEFLKNSKLAVVGASGEVFINADGLIERDSSKKYDMLFRAGDIINFIEKNGLYIPCSSVMMDKKLMLRKNLLFPSKTVTADELLWVTVLKYYDIKIISYPVTNRRIHDTNAEYSNLLDMKDGYVCSYKKFLDLSSLGGSNREKKWIRKFIKNSFSKQLIGIAILLVKKFRTSKISLWYLYQCLKIKPANLLTKMFWKALLLTSLNMLNLFDHFYELFFRWKYGEAPSKPLQNSNTKTSNYQ